MGKAKKRKTSEVVKKAEGKVFESQTTQARQIACQERWRTLGPVEKVVITTVPLQKGDYDRVYELKEHFSSSYTHEFGHGPRESKSSALWKEQMQKYFSQKNRQNSINIVMTELESVPGSGPEGTYDWYEDLMGRCHFSGVLKEYW